MCGVSAPVMAFDTPVTNIYDRNSFIPDDRDYYYKRGTPWQLYLLCFMRTSFGHFQLHHLGAETLAVAQSSFLRHVLWLPLHCVLSTPGHISMR